MADKRRYRREPCPTNVVDMPAAILVSCHMRSAVSSNTPLRWASACASAWALGTSRLDADIVSVASSNASTSLPYAPPGPGAAENRRAGGGAPDVRQNGAPAGSWRPCIMAAYCRRIRSCRPRSNCAKSCGCSSAAGCSCPPPGPTPWSKASRSPPWSRPRPPAIGPPRPNPG